MILYHGTGSRAALNIFRDEFIKRASKENSPYRYEGSDQTTYGYVYVTDDELEAVRYGIIASSTICVEESCLVVYIFEIDIDQDIVLPDKFDECRHKKWSFESCCPICNAETCLIRTKSATISQDLKLGNIVKRYKIIAIYNNKLKIIHDWKPIACFNKITATLINLFAKNKSLFKYWCEY